MWHFAKIYLYPLPCIKTLRMLFYLTYQLNHSAISNAAHISSVNIQDVSLHRLYVLHTQTAFSLETYNSRPLIDNELASRC